MMCVCVCFILFCYVCNCSKNAINRIEQNIGLMITKWKEIIHLISDKYFMNSFHFYWSDSTTSMRRAVFDNLKEFAVIYGLIIEFSTITFSLTKATELLTLHWYFPDLVAVDYLHCIFCAFLMCFEQPDACVSNKAHEMINWLKGLQSCMSLSDKACVIKSYLKLSYCISKMEYFNFPTNYL